MKRGRWLLAVIPALFLLRMGNAFPYPPGGAYSDFAISHYPNALYLQRALGVWRAFPWWSPLILSGAPFAADPLSSAWYPPHYLGLLFPLPFGLNLSAALHLWIGGLGMYRLLRRETLGEAAALFGALAFQSLPKLWAHYGAGHLTLWYALAWTPWALGYPTKRLPDHPTTRLPDLLTGFPAVLLAFLADPRWGPFAALLWAARLPRERRGALRRLRSDLARPASLGLLALALPYAALLWQFARLSTRAALTASESLAFSLPPARLLGMLLPLGGSQEFVLYPGAAVAALALTALLWTPRRAAARFWGAAAALSLAFALGDGLPFFAPLLVRLPGLNLLRVPSRALFLFGMALIALAAHALNALLTDKPPADAVRRITLTLTALAAAAALLALGAGALTGQRQGAWLWSAALWSASALGVGMSLRGRWPPRAVFAGLLGLALLDGGAAALRGALPRPAETALSEQSALAAYLAAQPGRFRVYSPSYSLPQQTAARYGLELADGVNPLQILGYAQFMAAATGAPPAGYSVTIPPFSSGDPARDNAARTPDARRLGLLNVRFVAAEFDLHAEGLRLVRRFGRTRLYENAFALGPAWVQPPQAAPGEGARSLPPQAVQWSPNRVRLRASGPGLLVLSEIAYPGWRVRVDGAPAALLLPAGLLRGVLLPAGEHTVEFSYTPALLTMHKFPYGQP